MFFNFINKLRLVTSSILKELFWLLLTKRGHISKLYVILIFVVPPLLSILIIKQASGSDDNIKKRGGGRKKINIEPEIQVFFSLFFDKIFVLIL